MFFRLSFVTLILAVGALGTPVIRDSDAGQVEADIKVLIEKARALDQSVKAFPKTGGTMEEVYVSALAEFCTSRTKPDGCI